MAAALSRLALGWRAIERFGEGRWAVPSVFVTALVVYGIVSIPLPLAAGRDLGNYLIVYAQLFEDRVVFPQPVLARTPGTPLLAGGLLDAGPFIAEAAAALLYALSIVAWYGAARRLGAGVAVVTAAVLLVYPSYVLLFHRLSSDLFYAAGFSLFALLAARAIDRPGAARWAAVGAAVAGLVLIRPVSQVLLLLAIAPLVVAGAWRARIVGTAAFAAAAVVPLLALVMHNGIRLDDYTVARGSGATLPLFRAFVSDRIVRTENGPATRELARAVARDLLPNEPYRSYGIDLERFFSSGSARMQEDLGGLADRTWGWDDDHRHLARVGREAVLSHPTSYARGVAKDIYRMLWWPLFVSVAESTDAENAGGGEGDNATIVVNGKRLPKPTEGEPIPGARQSGFVSTPGRWIEEVWTSPTEHRIVYDDPADAERGAEVFRTFDRLMNRFPDRDANAGAVERLNQLSRWFPRPIVWIAVGLVALALRRPRGSRTLVAISLAAFLVVILNALGLFADRHFVLPVAPAFVLLGLAGLLGTRGDRYPTHPAG